VEKEVKDGRDGGIIGAGMAVMAAGWPSFMAAVAGMGGKLEQLSPGC